MHNPEAEQAVLGAILMNNEALNHCEGLLAHHFYVPSHREMFQRILDMIDSGNAATPVSLQDPHAVKLMTLGTSISNTQNYSKIIIDHATRRTIRDICLHGSELEGTPEEILSDIEAKLFAVGESQTGGFEHISPSLDEVINRADRAFRNEGQLVGIDTGYAELNKIVNGWQNSDLIIVAGRPSMGKTALATCFGHFAAVRAKKVGFFSLEMSKVQLSQRLIASGAKISSSDIQAGRFVLPDFERMQEAKRELAKLPIHIDDTPSLSISALRSRARRLKRKSGMDLMIVDYLQLAKGTDKNRVTEISEITQGLKAIAKELNIPVIALSQLSRAVEQREDKRPQLSDLRESGSIEQDADIVIFVYREEYYLERTKPQEPAKYIEWLSRFELSKGKAEIIIAKHRNGATDKIILGFEGKTTSFHEIKNEPQYSCKD